MHVGHGIKTRSAVSSKLVFSWGEQEVSSSSGSIGHWGGSEPAGEETKNEYRELVLGMYE